MTDSQLADLDTLFQRFDHVTDALGKPIEPGIMETVVLLTALGYHTSQSCEGHVGWSQGVPWVMVEIANPPEGDEWYYNSPKVRKWVKKEVDALKFSLMDLLEGFYKKRKVPVPVRLTVNEGLTFVEVAPTAGDAALSLPKAKQVKLLPRYQLEMQEFTKYLRKKYLGK